MDIRNVLKHIIKEELGITKFSTEALTPQGHSLILFAKNDLETFEFALQNKDKAVIFDKAIKNYEKKFGEKLSGDRETVFYDFMAHYERPNTIINAEWIFGDEFGKRVVFDQSLGNTKFTVKTKREFMADVQQMADRAGYIANPYGTFDNNAEWITMRLTKRMD
jgi:hypothetical protein